MRLRVFLIVWVTFRSMGVTLKYPQSNSLMKINLLELIKKDFAR